MAVDDPAFGISTCWNQGRHPDCAAAVAEIVELDVGLVEVQTGGSASGFQSAAEFLRQTRARCYAVATAVEADDPRRFPSLIHPDPELRARANLNLEAAVRTAAILRTDRVVLAPVLIPVADAEVRLKKLGQALADHDQDGANRIYTGLFDDRSRGREQATEELCRVLYAVHKSNPGLVLEVLPAAGPLALLDFEETEWLLSELPACLRLRLDPAALTIRGNFGRPGLLTWAETWSERIESTYLCEPEGFRADSLPGPGVVDWTALAARLSPRTTSILKVDPASSTVAVMQAIRSFGRGLA